MSSFAEAAASGNYLRRTLKLVLSTFTAVEMLYDSALYKIYNEIDIGIDKKLRVLLRISD